MNIRERLKNSYENISFLADRTWSNSPDAFQKSNMDLCLKEKCVREMQQEKNRPRSIKESIPNSRLAQYSDFVYNESREMSYASNKPNLETICENGSENWQMREVSNLFKWFMNEQLEDDFSRYRQKHESPLMSVNGFEEKILKIHITKDRVKDIWLKSPLENDRPKSKILSVNLFCSPIKTIYLSNNNLQVDNDLFRSISLTKDHQLLEDLCNSFKKQSEQIVKILLGKPEQASLRHDFSNEILYSEVLQGLTPGRRILSTRNDKIDDVCSNQEAFTNFTVLNSQKLYRDTNKTHQNKFVSQNNSVYLQTERYRTVTQIPADPNSKKRPDYITEAIIETPTETASASVCSSTQFFAETSWLTQSGASCTSGANTRYLGQAVTRRSCNFEQIEINEFKEEIVDNEIISEVRVQRRTRINPLTLNQLRAQMIFQHLQRQANQRQDKF